MTNALTLIRQWSDLPAPSLDDLVGTWKAEFVPPLRHIGPIGLGLMGLPRWYGKRFERDGDRLGGVNLLLAGEGSFEERLPMCVSVQLSSKDGRPAGVVSYAAESPRPWRWIRDELRLLPGDVLLGMSTIDAGLTRRGPLPFLLVADSARRSGSGL